jgi:serine/threonine protein kinase
MHKNGVIHRDIKPDNILFDDAEDDNFKLIDFGLARVLEQG